MIKTNKMAIRPQWVVLLTWRLTWSLWVTANNVLFLHQSHKRDVLNNDSRHIKQEFIRPLYWAQCVYCCDLFLTFGSIWSLVTKRNTLTKSTMWPTFSWVARPDPAYPCEYASKRTTNIQCQRIGTETKWPPFSKRHFQINFLEWKSINFD